LEKSCEDRLTRITYAQRRPHRDAGEQLRLLIETVQDYAILTLDLSGHIASWNAGAERIKGYRAQDILGQHFSVFYPPEDVARGKPQWGLEVARREGRFEDEGWRLRMDGSRFWASVVITALFDETGKPRGFGKVTRDLTQRKQEEERLRQSEARFRMLVENIRDYAIFMMDPGGHIASWNAGAERIKGYRPEEIIGQHFSVFYPPEDLAWGKPQWELEVATREGRFEEEGWRVRKDGTRFWANVVITALFDETSTLRGFGKVTRDFTHRKQAEEAREMERLRDAVRARDEFLSVASHELKTPLTPLQLKLTAMLRAIEQQPGVPLSAERVARDLDTARRQVRKLADLIEDLLDVSRISVGKLSVNPAPVDLSALVREVVVRYAPQAAQAGCPVEVEAPAPVEGTWDPRRMEQVVTNLLTNALKYGAGKPLHLRVGLEEGRAVLSVRDEGIGIAPEAQPHIFERFMRAASARNYSGMGLGLFITREIVHAHGGGIRVESAPGKGAVFTVTLPLVAQAREG
jgi:PAS domain S-box-containing protein